MKKLTKKIGLLFVLTLCLSFLVPPVYASAEVPEAVNEEDNSRSTNLTWVFGYVDGVYCMRLLNHTTGEWVTDWIPVPPELQD